MMNDLINTQEAASCLGKITRFTIHRWMTKGLATPKGQLFLRFRRIGGRLYTTRKWLDRFLWKVSESRNNLCHIESEPSMDVGCTSTNRINEIRQAEDSANSRGF